ncbi:MAG: hypothetical protein LUH43_02740 [Clostridia bacterium]|nr:hypothetical protein [Clostridia bacterium]
MTKGQKIAYAGFIVFIALLAIGVTAYYLIVPAIKAGGITSNVDLKTAVVGILLISSFCLPFLTGAYGIYHMAFILFAEKSSRSRLRINFAAAVLILSVCAAVIGIQAFSDGKSSLLFRAFGFVFAALVVRFAEYLTFWVKSRGKKSENGDESPRGANKIGAVMRNVSIVMFMLAAAFVFLAVWSPTLGTHITLGGYRIDLSPFLDVFYPTYVASMAVLFIGSFFVRLIPRKHKKDDEQEQ